MNASTTGYGSLSTTGFPRSANDTVESSHQIIYRTAGILSLFTIVMNTNTRGASTATVRLNGAAGNQSVSIGASATGTFQDTTHTDAVNAGDKVAYQIVTGAGGSTFDDRLTLCLFDPSPLTVSILAYVSLPNLSTASQTTFYGVTGGASGAITTESTIQTKLRSPGTLKNFMFSVASNARTTATTANSRVNGANGNLAISVGASATGFFEDTTNSDALNVGDLIDFAVTTGTGAGTITGGVLKAELVTADGSFLLGESSSAQTLAANLTRYMPFGAASERDATESLVQQQALYPFVGSMLQITIAANSLTAASTFSSRKNGAAGNQSISIGSGATGLFEDTVNQDVYAASDLLSCQLVTGATGTTITPTAHSMRGYIQVFDDDDDYAGPGLLEPRRGDPLVEVYS